MTAQLLLIGKKERNKLNINLGSWFYKMEHQFERQCTIVCVCVQYDIQFLLQATITYRLVQMNSDFRLINTHITSSTFFESCEVVMF